jgi:Domain of unknown function (DUF4389)
MATAVRTYPVAVQGELDGHVSRGLWLVKWLLAIPHYIVLAFLWIAAVVMTVVAFFAILFTGRYPRGIFDFNVGVLRWSWRVWFYSYGALGTDRYPPFTLADVEDYPARLQIDYPERLSHWLPFVKWLLAIPHLILVGIFVSGGGLFATHSSDWAWGGGIGLIGLLVLIAAIALLFTGRYPRGLFDFTLGLDRWALRVAAYVGLMTDRYPPFRLDTGGSEAGTPVGPIPQPTAVTPTAVTAPAERAPWTAGRVALVVVGSLLALIGLASAAAGGFGLWAHTTQRDSSGYLMTSTERFTTSGYALASQSLHISSDVPSFLYGRDILGTVRVRGTSTDPRRPLFIGIARKADADAYLARVAHSDVTDIQTNPFEVTYRVRPGGPPASPPVRQTFWAASATGAGKQTVSWHVKSGHWVVVVMRPEGSRGVTADLAAGARLPALLGASIGVLAFGLLVVAGAAGLIYLGARERSP